MLTLTTNPIEYTSTPIGVSSSELKPTVYILDDDQRIRDGLANLVQSVGLNAVSFAHPDEFLADGELHRPACLVLDVRLPGRSGLDFQADLTRSGVTIPIVFISGYSDVPMSVRAMKAGAIEFITKPVRPQDLLDAVLAGIARDRSTLGQAEETAALKSKYLGLTSREQAVLKMVAEGLMNKQIAVRLEITEATVKVHRSNVMRKMDAATLPDLVRLADKLDLNRAVMSKPK